ncbi:MAG TPA: ArsR family transcriptional regulator [Candidatus Cloacimonetes bacterium]|nr:ArsR family transcriptional regulator [Candidatus Cloacimonadota bacterium]
MNRFEFIEHMAEVFKALSDPNRLIIIKLLVSTGDKDLCVADLAKALGISQPAVSQHLKILKNVKVLESQKIGFHVYYKVNLEIMNSLTEKVDKLLNMAHEECPENEVY